MNFNLISPSTNGNDYTINFKDPITIDRNSKISLNFLELTRNADIVLSTAQTIEFVLLNNLPTHLPGTPATVNTETFKIKIAKGVYEPSVLQSEIESKINSHTISGGQAFGNSKFVRYKAASSEGEAAGGGGEDPTGGIVGLVLDVTDVENFAIDGANSKDATQTTSGGAPVAYTTTNNNGVFDNYANSLTHFDFYRGNCPEYQGEMNSFVHLESIDNIYDQTGKLFFGLVGKEYTTGIGAAPTRTNGGTIVLKSGVPSCFVGVECQESTGHIVIYMAQNATGETIDTWTNQNQEIADMEVVARLPVSTTVEPSQPYNLLFGMEISNKTKSPTLRWKIASYQDGIYKPLYDSEPVRRNLPFELLVASAGITYDNATALNSQIPFGIQLSATNADEGWERCSYSGFDKAATNMDDNHPLSIARDYNVTFSDELAQVLGIKNDGIITGINPNFCQDEGEVVEESLDLNWKSQNYSIFINLPTNNYKNVAEKRDGGFKKSILANIPSPFTTGALIAKEGTDAGKVICIYQPYVPITSEMKNNELQVNTMSIKIVDMLTEQPATEILSSVVNFTIHD